MYVCRSSKNVHLHERAIGGVDNFTAAAEWHLLVYNFSFYLIFTYHTVAHSHWNESTTTNTG